MTAVNGAQPGYRERTGVAAAIGSLVERWPIHLTLVVIGLLWLLPSVALLTSSFRPANEVLTTGWWNAFSLPFEFTLQNYQDVLSRNNIGQSFINSLFVSIPATLIPIMVAAFAAYAFAWMDFPGRNALFTLVVGLLVIPLQSALVPVLQLLTDLRITGSFLAIWLAHTGFGLPFGIFLLRNFIGALPREMFESAFIDGASPVTAFFRLVLPLSVPAIASFAIFQFMWVWNDLLVALIILGGTPDVAPLPVQIASLVQSLGQGWHLLTAAAFVSMALPLVVFFGLQRYFVRGILGGSIKG
ncbi:MAG TPA: carbohydrate ABC transporter permease [candidate division Zixibacteria bacterium]|nr:carbohydrate ABC transporter permease [candidate division Zixibacteria bacterium]